MSDEQPTAEDSPHNEDTTTEGNGATPSESVQTPDVMGFNASDEATESASETASQAPANDILGSGTHYQFEQPRGQQYTPDQMNAYGQVTNQLAHRTGITDPAQAQKLFEALSEGIATSEAQQREMTQQLTDQYRSDLEREHGQIKAGELRQAANQYLGTIDGGNEFAQVLVETGIAQHPQVVKFLAAQATPPEPKGGGAPPNQQRSGNPILDYLTGNADTYR